MHLFCGMAQSQFHLNISIELHWRFIGNISLHYDWGTIWKTFVCSWLRMEIFRLIEFTEVPSTLRFLFLFMREWHAEQCFLLLLLSMRVFLPWMQIVIYISFRSIMFNMRELFTCTECIRPPICEHSGFKPHRKLLPGGLDWPVQRSGGRRSSGGGLGALARGPGWGTDSGWSEGAGWCNCRSCSSQCTYNQEDSPKKSQIVTIPELWVRCTVGSYPCSSLWV